MTEACELADGKCVPCRGGVPPMSEPEARAMAERLDNGWELVDGHHLRKTYRFKNFREALDFTNRLGAVAEAEKHHPNIFLAWGEVTVELWTHKIDGLTESDFILAAKADRAL
jgi:4a-hydroxytetrahydrobiopterin dehydratase